MVSARLEKYRENPEKTPDFIALQQKVEDLIARDYMQQILPGEVVETEGDI